MRNLTIKREKTFVGSLMKVHVYIEDHFNSEITINNVPCRKLGDLKNNEEKTFEIGEEELKVFVIGDKLSKEFCNDFFQILSGENDVYLSGKNQFNPASGNAFRFNNNDFLEVKNNRKKGVAKGLLILVFAIIVGWGVGYFIGAFSDSKSFKNADPKTFSEKGMNITLTTDFRISEEDEYSDKYTVCYESSKAIVLVLKEEFSLLPGASEYTLEEYGELVLKANNLTTTKIKDIEGMTGFEYEATSPDNNETYRYISFIFKAEDAFWMVQFATNTKITDKYYSDIIKWAKSISFDNVVALYNGSNLG